MKYKFYHKLVRDRIPEIIAESGNKCTLEILRRAEYLDALKEKLHEELAEFEASNEPEELADMLEVIYAIAEAIGGTVEQLERMRAGKAKERGGFKNRFYLTVVEEEEDITDES